MPRKSLEDLERQDFWSLAEFGRLKCGRLYQWVKQRLEEDSTGLRGVLRLPGGVVVPVSRDHNGHWTVARVHYEQAVRQAATTMEAAG